MKNIVERINELETEAWLINTSDRLSTDERNRLIDIDEELRELRKILKNL